MAKRSEDEVPSELTRAHDAFAKWRARRTRGARIPKHLWTLAVRAAGVHGVTRTIQTLSLDYYALKARMTEAEEAAPAAVSELGEVDFVELPWLPVQPKRACSVELREEGGKSLRLELDGMSAADIAAVVSGLWKAQR